MSKNDKQHALVPRLRFPEFREKPAWSTSRLGDFATIVKGRGISKADITSDGALTAIRYAELYTVYGEVIREIVSRTNLDTDGLVLSKQGDVIIPASGETKADIATAACVSISGVALGSDLNIIRSHLHGPFFSYYLNGSKRADIAKVAQGDTVAHLYPGQLEKIIVHYPKPAEQRKIADCLGSLDDLIAAEGRKLAALQDHKQGLMQQLFPREGETRPHLRFPEFRNAAAWEAKKAGSLFSQRKEKGEAGLPIYSVTINDGMVLRSTFDRNFYDIEDPAGNKKSCKNDIAYNMMRMWQGACGVAPEDCMVSPAYVVLQPKKGTCPAFFDVLFKRPATLHLLMAYSRGLTLDRLRLYFDDFTSIPLLVPAESEQQRIADCLSALDALLTAQAEKLDALRTHKRGLMQQLFPSPEDLSP